MNAENKRKPKGLVDRNPPESNGPPSIPRRVSICPISRVVYDNIHAPQLEVLREFRDNVLRKYELGKAVIATYYGGLGKTAANFVSRHASFLVPGIRRGLDFVVEQYQARK